MEIKSFGKYTVIQPLGSGGMAAVYEARDSLLDRQVAIKIIHPHLAQESNFASRFRQEARLVAALRHPHIVRLYDFDILNDQPFMVMEYLDGGTLKDRLTKLRRQGKRLPLGTIVQILKTLAGALDYAHAHGAVHRDIKPANILFTDRDEPVITDFGIAKLLTESVQISHTGGIIGTPAYMSPEQVAGKAVDGRSDQYSLAVMVYELVAGQAPFIADTTPAILVKHLSEIPASPRSLNPKLPVQAEQVLLRALEKEPSARFPTITEFADAFAAALHSAPTASREAGDQSTEAGEATEVDASIAQPVPAGRATALDSGVQAPAPLRVPPSAPPLPATPVKKRAAIPPGLLRRGGWAAGVVILLVVGVVLFFSLGGLDLLSRQPAALPGGYTLAIANFDGSQASITVDFGRRIFEQLENELADLEGEVRLVRLDQTYTEAETARSAGEEQGFSIIIWGWYDDLGVSPHVEVIQPPAPSAERGGLFLQTAHATSLAEAGGAAQLELGDFFSYLRVPYRVDEMNLFVQNGPDQVAYIAEAVLALAYQYQGELDTALTLYDKAISKAETIAPAAGAAQNVSPGMDVLYLQRSIGLVEAGRLAEAVQDLEQARLLNPELPEAHYNLAILYAETCSPALRTEDAIASAEEAVRLQPDDIASQRLLASLYTQAGDLDKARDSARAALELDSQDTDSLLLLGSILAASDDPIQANASYKQAFQILKEKLSSSQGTDVAPLHIALGDAYLQAGQLDEARAAYLQAQALIPDDPAVHRGLGSLALQADQLEPAVEELQRWVELEPDNSSALILLGLAYLKLERHSEMLAVFEEARTLTPCDPDIHLLLGGYYWRQGEHAQAEAEYIQAASLEPYNASSSYLLGATQLLQDKPDEAKSALSRAVSLDPQLSIARYALASVYYEQGDYALARDELQALVQDDPQDSSVFVSLGNAYDNLGESDQAIAAYEQALSLKDDPNVHTYLGSIYYQRGDFERSIQEYTLAVAGDPQMSLAHMGLGDALEQSGDLQGAIDSYRSALALEEAPLLRAQLATLLARLGDVPGAIQELETAVNSEPENPLLIRQISLLYSRVGRLDEAEAQYQALLALDESNPEGYYGLGQIAYKRCDLSSLSQNYAQAATLGSEMALYFWLPAAAYAAQGAVEQQSEVITALLEKFPSDPFALLLAGEAFLADGQVLEADEALQSVLQVSSLPPLFQSLAHYDLGQVQLLRGNTSAAEGEFRLALEKFPANAAAQIALGDLALRAKDSQAALLAYEQADALLPEYGIQVSGDAVELMQPLLAARRALAQKQSGSTVDALSIIDQAQEVVDRTPEWPQARFMLGLIYYSLGQDQAAETEFAAAVQCDASLEAAVQRAKEEVDLLR